MVIAFSRFITISIPFIHSFDYASGNGDVNISDCFKNFYTECMRKLPGKFRKRRSRLVHRDGRNTNTENLISYHLEPTPSTPEPLFPKLLDLNHLHLHCFLNTLFSSTVLSFNNW
ncbi:hypothetical protein VNO77_01473 [Canavalia gladiata]|uniref:Uncharacterized protein n=1 Tax=Canavalia gladiata TaxID=3824 RepID=A0AAN9MWH6_CANGL